MKGTPLPKTPNGDFLSHHRSFGGGQGGGGVMLWLGDDMYAAARTRSKWLDSSAAAHVETLNPEWIYIL